MQEMHNTIYRKKLQKLKTVGFIPIKLNNERLPGKNTKSFFDGTTLMHLVQKKLLKIQELDEIHVFCSDERITDHCIDGVKFLLRPKYLDNSSATPQDILREFIVRVDSDIYLTAHVTSPFVQAERFTECIRAVRHNGFDSAFMVQRLKKLLWDGQNHAVNFDPEHIPRTQDLPPLFAEISAAYVFKKEVFTKLGRRIGINPYIVEVDTIESIDIDYPVDFAVANAVYKEIISKNLEL